MSQDNHPGELLRSAPYLKHVSRPTTLSLRIGVFGRDAGVGGRDELPLDRGVQAVASRHFCHAARREFDERLHNRCGNNSPPEGHPMVCWKVADLERAIVADLAGLHFDSPEIRSLLRRPPGGRSSTR